MAEGLTDRSVNSYERLLNKWIEYGGDKDVTAVTTTDIHKYLAWLRTEYVPQRYNGKTHKLSSKSLRNVWVTLSSFFGWASLELGYENLMKKIPAPKVKKKPVEAFTKDEIDALLKVCSHTRKAETRYRESFSFARPTAKRDRALILILCMTYYSKAGGWILITTSDENAHIQHKLKSNWRFTMDAQHRISISAVLF